MRKNADANRYVQLTDIGLKRFHAARHRYKTTVDAIVVDMSTPSVNTIKRVLRQEAVFVSTLERLWDYFLRQADACGERISPLIEGTDYVFLEGNESQPQGKKPSETSSNNRENKRGWMSRSVPRPNRLFTGRREMLDNLHSALQASPVALTTDSQALTGLGGIGKTQTALAYIYEHWRDYERVFWITAETVDSLNDGLVRLAEELQLLEVTTEKKPQALQRMHDWLRNESHWLLILDNADDLETLAPHLPRHHAGHLILTTRVRNTVKWAASMPLERFCPDEGALLLLRRAGLLHVQQTLQDASSEAATAAKELSVELDGLPLALDQAGAYLAETMGSISEYHALYRALGLQLLDSRVDPEHVSVTITFTLAVEQMAKRSHLGKEAVELIKLCAFLAPDAIPETILASYPFGADNFPAQCDADDTYLEICATVCGYSMASRNPESNTLAVHRLVQKVTRDTMSPEEQRLWAGRAVDALAAATPDFEFEDWSLCDQLLPQWRVSVEYIRHFAIESPQSAHVLYQAGRYLRARALYTEAEELLRMAVEIAEKVLGTHSLKTADYLDELACLYRVLDRREEAEAFHIRAIDIIEQTEGTAHLLLASKLHNFALLFLHYEDYPHAELLLLRALTIHEKQSQPDRLLMATAQTQLAGVYRHQERFDKAEHYCRQALATYESLLEPAHIDIATGCNNLALLYLTTKRYGEAEEFYLRALEINEEKRGKDHPETGTVIWGLARVCWKQDRVEEAEVLFRRALNIYEKHFGKHHSRFLKLRSSYQEFQSVLSSYSQ